MNQEDMIFDEHDLNSRKKVMDFLDNEPTPCKDQCK